MKKVLLLAILAAAFAAPVLGGQMSSHIYTAIRSQQYLSGSAATCVKKFEPEYLAGAQGPDTSGVVMHALDTVWSSVGEETHYDALKAELALNILDAASDMREKAYAVGWISHYINDIYVHAVVNEWGGYYKVAPYHHKEMEQLETMHAINAHGDIVTEKRSVIDYDSMGDNIPFLLFGAYHKTWPKNSLYDPGRKDYFLKRYNEAAGWSTSASKAFYNTATNKDKKGKHDWELATVKFPNMPSFEDYEHFQSAIEIKDVKPGKDKLIATIRINDSKLYGRFLVDWEKAADKAISHAKKTYAILCDYMDEKVPAKKAALRKTLLAAIPNQNLDQPLSTFDADKVFPGDKSYTTPYYSCVFTPSSGSGSPVEVKGNASVISVESTGWSGSQVGETTVEIPVPSGAYPYQYELKVAITGKEAFTNPDYYTRDWVKVSGGTSVDGDGKVNLGDVFDVNIKLTPKIAKLPGRRIWLVVNEEPNSNSAHLQGSIQGAKIAFALSHQSVGTLPGNKEFYAELGRHRYDVAVISESIDGDVLKARLQITNPALEKNTGSPYLVCVFLDHEQCSSLEYAEAFKKFNEAVKKAKSVNDVIDKKVESLSESKRKQLMAEAQKYEEGLKKQNLSEDEIGKLMEKKFFEMMIGLGVKLTKDQQALLDNVDAADKALEAKSNSYNCAYGKFVLRPVKIQMDTADGWKMSESGSSDDANKALKVSLERNLSSSDYPGMGSSSSIQVTFTDAADAEANFAKYNSDNKGSKSAFQLGPYTGTMIASETVTQDGTEWVSSQLGDALLKYNKTYLLISYNLHARGWKDQSNNIDGIPTAKSTAEALSKQCDAMLGSIKLVPKSEK